ncbi:GMP synthase [glutamine-hydrolyzing] [Aliiroseovarius pelagivivens]|uniref:GMP synthase [glutamine-hydrolyzing] n=1 Tax=Aliiroseovarius pelagivivens TaxID=1639690 RepID=A0A2R8AK43_9RHOB|nr:glutamine amidotransferase [Aliiroseovarius pelagivivens]SPF76418.1 GMP synthase [glutamine-hydrolyzing] [Aliiroseovarius pelagivivens]
MKPFLILQLRPETDASDDEFQAFLSKGGLSADQVHRIRLDQERIPDTLDLTAYSGVIVGGGPGCVSDAPDKKSAIEAKIEAECLSLMPEITTRDIPFLGCCYGIGILGHHLKPGAISKDQFGEPVSASPCRLTDEGRDDPLLKGIPDAFEAFVGHKEAMQQLPEGCTQLVTSAPCPFQMIRFGQNVYATQFHPEADAHGFETRIGIYKHHGYFPPEEAEALVDMVHAANVHAPAQILRNFVDRYRDS